MEKLLQSDLETTERENIKQDLSLAKDIINDALKRCIEINQDDNQAVITTSSFDDLSSYASEREIRDAYAFDMISSSEYSYLMNLWKAREQHAFNSKKVSDRVIEIIKKAINIIDEQYRST